MSTDTYAIIGAAGGIGSDLCRLLDDRGVRLVLGGRSEEPLQTLASDLTNAQAVPVDARDFASVESFVATAADAGSLKGVVNLAGSILLKPAHLTKRDELDDVIATNLITAFAVVRAAVRPLRKAGGGSIILMSTAAAEIGLANHEAIAAAKGGVAGLTRSAAATYATWGVRVNAIGPGLVDTPLADKITSRPAALEHSKALHPLGRIGQPHDIAGLLAWLLSDQATWVTGQIWNVDGGLSRVRAA
ncbi:MAG: SDR family oxidoreductase [Acidobacteriota bacterium]